MTDKQKKNVKRAKRRRLRVRLPLPPKPGRPIGPPSGKKNYDRKKNREEIERDRDEN